MVQTALNDLCVRTLTGGAGGDPHAFLPVVALDWTCTTAGAYGTITFIRGYQIRVPDGEGGTTAAAISDVLAPGSVVVLQKHAQEPRFGRLVLADYSEAIITDGDNSVEEITYEFTSLEQWLTQAIGNYPSGDAVEDDVYTDATPGLFFRQQWTAARSRGCLADFDNLDFTNTDDSLGVGWQSVVSRRVLPGSDLLTELRWLTETVGVAWYYVQGATLRLINAGLGHVDWTDPDDPGNTLGKALYLHPGTDLSDGLRDGTPLIANRVVVLGGDGRYAIGEDDDSISEHGPRETHRNAPNITDMTQLQTLADLYAEVLGTDRQQVTHEVVLGNGKDPLDTYNVGDMVYVRDGSAPGPYKAVVASIALHLDQTGKVTCDIATGARRDVWEARIQSQIDAIINGSDEGARPSRNALAPEAPVSTGHTFTIVDPVGPGDEMIRLDGTFTWSGLDTDGAPCGDIAALLVAWKFGDKGWLEKELDPADTSYRVEFPIPHAGREVHVRLGARDEAGNTTWGTELT